MSCLVDPAGGEQALPALECVVKRSLQVLKQTFNFGSLMLRGFASDAVLKSVGLSREHGLISCMNIYIYNMN